MSMEKKMGVLGIIDKPAFLLPSILIVSAIIFGAVAPDIFNDAASAAFTFVTKYFSWFYALGVSLMIVFCFWAAFGKYGKIKLGGSDAKPTMSFTSWFFVTLISGKGVMVAMMALFGQSLVNALEQPLYLILAAVLLGGLYWISKVICKKHHLDEK